MSIIIVLALLMITGLIIVSLIHETQRKEQMRHMQQRRLRLQVDELNEVLSCIEQTIGNKDLAKKINELIMGLLHTMRRLETKPTPYIDSAIQKVLSHNQELDNPQLHFHIRYERESDAQINKAQQQLAEAITILSSLTAQGKIAEVDFEIYHNQLRWTHLMVGITSYVAQGNKCMAISDRVTALAFYQRALHLLMESSHPNPKRLTLIREINEMLEGNRSQFSDSLLMPYSHVQTSADVDSI